MTWPWLTSRPSRPEARLVRVARRHRRGVLDAGEVAVAARRALALEQHDLPAVAARIGVPVGTPMSMPGWQDSQARRSQNGEVIGPLTGQIRLPEPRLIGPATLAAGAACALAGLSWEVRARRPPRGRPGAPAGAGGRTRQMPARLLARLRALVADALVDELLADRRDLVAACEDRAVITCWRRLERSSRLRGVGRVPSRRGRR